MGEAIDLERHLSSSTDAQTDGHADERAEPQAEQTWRVGKVASSLASVNVLSAAAGLLTAPLLARALGPDGRGQLAAILVPLAFAPALAGLGIGAFVRREAARCGDERTAVRELLPVAAIIGLVAAAAGPIVADLLAEGRTVVALWLTIGFALMPFSLVGLFLLDLTIGLERWRTLLTARLVTTGILLLGIPVLFVVDELTVATAALVNLTSGIAAGIVLALGITERSRPRPTWSRTRAALRFGLPAWMTTLGTLANARLDQLVMIVAVSERELGLYAIAVSLGYLFAEILTASLEPAVSARIARGEPGISHRSVRVTLAVTAIATLGVMLLAQPVISILFGDAFEDAVPMFRILALAGVLLSGSTMLKSVLINSGYPGMTARSEGLTLVVTCIGLALLLRPLEGTGAAIVSVAAYAVSFAYLLRVTRRIVGGSYREFLVPRRSDLGWFRAALRERLRPHGAGG